ncbi:hypothetical protein HF319_07235 [Xanthomonas sp. Kuri4-1]
MPLAGLFTLAAVALSLRFVPAPQHDGAAALLALYALLFVAFQLTSQRAVLPHLVLAAMPVVVLGMAWLAPGPGTAQVLLVIWVACTFAVWPLRRAAVPVLLANTGLYLIMRDAGHEAALVAVLVNLGFQLLAGLCVLRVPVGPEGGQ